MLLKTPIFAFQEMDTRMMGVKEKAEGVGGCWKRGGYMSKIVVEGSQLLDLVQTGCFESHECEPRA